MGRRYDYATGILLESETEAGVYFKYSTTSNRVCRACSMDPKSHAATRPQFRSVS